ncbi:amino acid/amide ABC transporter ATP-binding protein 1, HAAT family [Haladaptatus litoreus]|uniref:Probable branched-chain amino acid transport ATP-binding protein LivG n=1 Tax=Haladaptatus litoreus TaxID=553468 RepID=A0A1N7DZC1_9EURY|nr:ABC transporter ATP-binding protein [Haladaptatus litoreus]SIR81141.1 amino acid/amide ABC transporter ATP-binding protein 1, HAAT family [Haladaptatus litoreus]
MALLETENLTRQFGELVATDNVNLAVEAGEFRSVIGPNGAGKTTLFNLITGALFPTSGSVRFMDEEVSNLPPHERVRRGIGRSFQITTVFGGLSVRENVRLSAQAMAGESITAGNRMFRPADSFPEINERVDDVLSQIGLGARADEQAAALAYGDRRRLEIGLVLATDPQVVLLDEPTAGMSVEETQGTMALIDEVLADRTLLLIEHDIDLVMNVSDRITVLNRGKELATGTPQEVAENDEVQKAYLGGM